MSSSIESAFRVLASVIGPDDEKITLRNLLLKRLILFFFFQAEDGIRDVMA